ncbi:DUF1513 domain-containing protein [Phaeobacter sp. B1627]|uniref:DUF1513 domain-containing protein n=1 Tax=Phaeobacter sp. B1627 TaxID=2583809 RepID=UPI0011185EE8|nr:DUF1513 domain-containing protein [Phaeobacter sp. B1627]TNJ41850.1 DUF1513 domain-containing protein [Phaeobacter sp. B1627]
MQSRRGFLAGLMATGMAPKATWADAGAPAFLAAGKDELGLFVIAGLSATGEVLFRHTLPDRGHAASAHPTRPEAVAFARRPGRFADVIDCRSGAQLARLEPPAGHHFYGHGVFSPDASVLFTTENAFETADGMIGVWDAGTYARIGQFPSGAIGPHEVLLRQDAPGLVIANGGIETHPDSGRAKLNIPFMRPSLSYLTLDGQIEEIMELPAELHKNSIRHIAVRSDGTVGFAMQWQGDPGDEVPIVGLHRPGDTPRLMAEGDPRRRNLNGYGGSIAFSGDETQIAVTSPRGGVVQIMACATGHLVAEHHLPDVCGLARTATGLLASTGTGAIVHFGPGMAHLATAPLAWDNHLIPLG